MVMGVASHEYFDTITVALKITHYIIYLSIYPYNIDYQFNQLADFRIDDKDTDSNQGKQKRNINL